MISTSFKKIKIQVKNAAKREIFLLIQFANSIKKWYLSEVCCTSAQFAQIMMSAKMLWIK
jgi:uncharacterized protein YybS (DUF2232 family)